MRLDRDFSEFIELLRAHDVRFLVVGGYAVAAHGHPRYTGDLDVWGREYRCGEVSRFVGISTGVVTPACGNVGRVLSITS